MIFALLSEYDSVMRYNMTFWS